VPDTVVFVVLDNANYSYDREYSYSVPEHLESSALPGCRVTVPFSAGNGSRVGLITGYAPGLPGKKLKRIISVLDEKPYLDAEMLELVKWLKDRTFCTYFEAAKAILPTGINLKTIVSYAVAAKENNTLPLSDEERAVFEFIARKGNYVKADKVCRALGLPPDCAAFNLLYKKGLLLRNVDAVQQVGDQTARMARLVDEGGQEKGAQPKLTKKQKSIVSLLEDVGAASIKEICYFTGYTPAVVAALEKKGIIEYFETPISRSRFAQNRDEGCREPIVLTNEQNRALENMKNLLAKGQAAASLLYGVTGSGKTSVYLRLIDEVLDQGRDVIVMVPEIALTPQALTIFSRRYGSQIAVFHSALPVGERADEWKRVKNAQAKIAVGTRSAVFAPFRNLGLIIMDEEQEHTYKSEKSPRYNALDVARFRCAKHNALLVLSSATPSIESYAAAKKGTYQLNTLTKRYGNAYLPDVVTVDMLDDSNIRPNSEISTPLLEEMKENLEAGRQCILLINRRGYHTFAACRQCRHVVTCPSCSISLTYHRANNRLMCHYCGFSQPYSDICPECGNPAIRYSGFGTQRIEEDIRSSLPEARVLRMDTDSTVSRFSHEDKLSRFAAGEYDILLGTQMVAKGFDFESVTLAGVISVDQQLNNDDFRSLETVFSLLTQVVGRSGRGKFAGKAIIQTMNPQNEIIAMAAKQDYEAFYNREIKIRKMLIYPPFCDICAVCFSGAEEAAVKAAAQTYFEQLKIESARLRGGIIVLGPMPARVGKVSNQYRYRLLIKCKNNQPLRDMVRQLILNVSTMRTFSAVTVFADMNPKSML